MENILPWILSLRETFTRDSKTLVKEKETEYFIFFPPFFSALEQHKVHFAMETLHWIMLITSCMQNNAEVVLSY